MISGIKRIFNNCDKILKGIAIFNFIACIVFTIIFDFFFLTMILVRFVPMAQAVTLKLILFPIVLIVGFIASIIFSIPLYNFAEIVTQLKQINAKIK